MKLPAFDAPQISAAELEELSRIAKGRWGLELGEKKRAVVEGRLRKLLGATGSDDVPSLLHLLRSDREPAKALAAFDVLSTNHTHFFREAAHYRWLRSEVFDRVTAHANNPPRLRVWSAGCSNGCEPYTLAMIASDSYRSLQQVDFKVLATDLSISQLRLAKAGRYAEKHLEGVPGDVRARHFQRVQDEAGLVWEVRPTLRACVRFGLLNLLEGWPMRGPFDAIFCRNVMIYFDDATRRALVQRFLGLLRPGGLLFLGTSEAIPGKIAGLRSLESSAYQKNT